MAQACNLLDSSGRLREILQFCISNIPFSHASPSFIKSVPLALRAVIDQLDDEIVNQKDSSRIGEFATLGYKNRSAQCSIMDRLEAQKLSKFAVSPKYEMWRKSMTNQAKGVRTRATVMERVRSDSFKGHIHSIPETSTIDEEFNREDFAFYFSSPPSSAERDANCVSMLRVPLDPDLTAVMASTQEQMEALTSSFESRLIDSNFLECQLETHEAYRLHSLKYIVPLERALQSESWRDLLPSGWCMETLTLSAIEGVLRGDHCLEIRFIGTPASQIQDLLFATMTSERARWYSNFLSEEVEEETDQSSELELPPSEENSTAIVSLSSSDCAHDLRSDIDAMGPASLVSLDDYRHGPDSATFTLEVPQITLPNVHT